MKRKEFLKRLAIGTAAVAVGGPVLKEVGNLTLGSAVESGTRTIAATNYSNGDVVTYIMNGQKYWYRMSELKKYQEFMEEKEREVFSYLKF